VPGSVSRGIAPCPGCPTDCIKVYAGAGLHQEALAAIGGADPWSQRRRYEQERIDPVSTNGTLTVNGVAIPPFDPRAQPNLGLAYAVAPIGPRYDIVEHDLDVDPVEGLPESFGFTAADDQLPDLYFSEPTAGGEVLDRAAFTAAAAELRRELFR